MARSALRGARLQGCEVARPGRPLGGGRSVCSRGLAELSGFLRLIDVRDPSQGPKAAAAVGQQRGCWRGGSQRRAGIVRPRSPIDRLIVLRREQRAARPTCRRRPRPTLLLSGASLSQRPCDNGWQPSDRDLSPNGPVMVRLERVGEHDGPVLEVCDLSRAAAARD